VEWAGRELVNPDVVGSFSCHHDESLAGLQLLQILSVFRSKLVIEGQSFGDVSRLYAHD
jgi:hypothetical protein